jgi:meso-butanediol dehydrogenase/(S,S)-butanediol dehydrogenase/diacetyl reductase
MRACSNIGSRQQAREEGMSESDASRVAVVTGAASGIGRAVGEQWLVAGGSLVAVDLVASDFDGEHTGRAVAITGDVSDPATSARMVAAAVDRFGGLDALVLNAGMPATGAVDDLPLETFERVLDVNLRGVVLGLRAALPALRGSTSAAVVVTASVSGLGGDPGMWAYNTAKGAVVNFVRAASLELASQGIRVNAVCPGPIRTGMTKPITEAAPAVAESLQRNIPLQRWGEAGEVAAVITFLASPAASFVTGAIVPVDGGISASSGQFPPPRRPAA